MLRLAHSSFSLGAVKTARCLACLASLALSGPLWAKEDKKEGHQEVPTQVVSETAASTAKPLSYACIERESVTQGEVTIQGKRIGYTAKAGTFVLRDPEGQEKATLFYVAYTKTDTAKDEKTANNAQDTEKRPITFCTNGGPGAASVWLHMGLLGPMRIVLRDTKFTPPPYQLVENNYSLLDQTDLVFIDPVSTGFSRAITTEAAKQFHGVKEDVQWVSEFIRLYLTRNDRWLSPKFFFGESYGTARAAVLLHHLHTEQHMDFNGVCLLSTILDFQTLRFDAGNDMPYLLALPTYTATAWYHQRLPKELQEGSLLDACKEAEQFALNGYALALLKGSALSTSEEQTLVDQLSRLTGLSPLYIRQSNYRVNMLRFVKELLRDKHEVVGRFDARVTGVNCDVTAATMEYDPSMDISFGAFTAGFNDYVHKTLQWNSDLPYQVLVNVYPWNFGDAANNRYLNTSQYLEEMMQRNPKLHVFIGSGYYDLATPYFGADFTTQQMCLPAPLRSNLTTRYYKAGHMMYIHLPSLEQLREDLKLFYQNSLKAAADEV